MAKKSLCLTAVLIQRYAGQLRDQERSAATIQKYVHDLTALSAFLAGRPMTKGLLLEWKEELVGQYAPASVNTMLAAVNRFLTFCGRSDLRLRPLKIQRALFLPEDKELTRAEYVRLVKAAERNENQRLALVLQTICATGIRVSELKFITAEAVQTGRAEVTNKGKRRAVFLPEKLRRLLKGYLRAQKITAGAVFVSRKGNPLEPQQHLAGHESPVPARGGGAGQGVSPQFEASVRPDLLRAGKGSVPAGGPSGPQQCEHHPHLHGGERSRPRPADRAIEPGGHIIFVLWLRHKKRPQHEFSFCCTRPRDQYR